jgi:hypothetical protein
MEFHGIPWNPTKTFDGFFMNFLMEFHWKFHGILETSTPWNFRFVDLSPWNPIEFSIEFHGIFHEFTEWFSPGRAVGQYIKSWLLGSLSIRHKVTQTPSTTQPNHPLHSNCKSSRSRVKQQRIY